jgi:hypothetical protein
MYIRARVLASLFFIMTCPHAHGLPTDASRLCSDVTISYSNYGFRGYDKLYQCTSIRYIRDTETELHSFLDSSLDGGECDSTENIHNLHRSRTDQFLITVNDIW